MKKTLIVLLSAIYVLVLTSCQKEPQAGLTASKQTAEVNESIVFTSTSQDGYSYEWSFGDGTTSKSETAVHAYTTAGNYVVTLKVFSKNGKKSDEATTMITVTASTSNSVTHDGNDYQLNAGMIQFFGDYFSMGNGNYDILLFSSGISFSGTGLTGTGDILYFELFSLLSGLTASTYTFDPLNTYATYTFTTSSGFFKNYNTGSGTSDGTVSFNSGTVVIAITGSQYEFTISLVDNNAKSLTGSYSGTLDYVDSSKSSALMKFFKR
jgi:PKD repeat protein